MQHMAGFCNRIQEKTQSSQKWNVGNDVDYSWLCFMGYWNKMERVVCWICIPDCRNMHHNIYADRNKSAKIKSKRLYDLSSYGGELWNDSPFYFSADTSSHEHDSLFTLCNVQFLIAGRIDYF